MNTTCVHFWSVNILCIHFFHEIAEVLHFFCSFYKVKDATDKVVLNCVNISISCASFVAGKTGL